MLATVLLLGMHWPGAAQWAAADCNCSLGRGVPLGDLANKWKPSKFVPHLHCGYQRFYDFMLEPLRYARTRLLEIGLESGAGTSLWKEFFPAGELFGIDVDPEATATDGAKQATVFVGSQADVAFLERVIHDANGTADVVIDDGGHTFTQQMTSYRVLFAKFLKPGGLYIIEDIETSYWKEANLYGMPVVGGLHHPETTIYVMKERLPSVVQGKPPSRDAADGVLDGILFLQNVVALYKKGARPWAQWADGCDCSAQFNRSVRLEGIHRPKTFFPSLHGRYQLFYDSLLEPLRQKPVRVLLASDTKLPPTACGLWQDYFDDVECVRLLTEPGSATTTRPVNGTLQGDLKNSSFAEAFGQLAGGQFDMIIDHGAKRKSHSIALYQALFPMALKLGGVHVIADAHGEKCHGPQAIQHVVCYFRAMVDVVNRKFHDNHFYVGGPVDWWVRGVAFFPRTVVVLKKDPRDKPYDAHYEWPHQLHPPGRDQGTDEQWGPSPL